MIDRDKANKAARISQDPADWNHYRRLKNRVNSAVDKDKKNHYNKIYNDHISKNDAGTTFKNAKDQVGWKSPSSPINFIVEGKPVTDPQKMAEIQVDTFSNKVQKLIDDLPITDIDPLATLNESLSGWKGKSDREVFKLEPTTSLKLLSIIGKIKNSTSFAHDKLDAMMIKHGIQYLHAPLVHVINLSIRMEKFVNRWKVGKILPLHK